MNSAWEIPLLFARTICCERGRPDKSLFRLTATGWNPAAFVDLVASIADTPKDPRYPLALSIQQIEWQTVFDYCVRAAGG